MSIAEKVRLGEVAKVISGYAFKSSEFSDEGVPVVKIANIRVGLLDLVDSQKVSHEYLEDLNEKYRVGAGDILVSLTGSHITQPNSVVGRVARAPKSCPSCLLNQRAGKVILTDQKKCDLGFLYYYLTMVSLRGDIAAMASGAASQANVSPGQVESLWIELPLLDDQVRVAAILSTYDDLIENNARRIEILEEMARRLYDEWFVQLRFPGHEETGLRETDLGCAPDGWANSTLGEIADEIRDAIHPSRVDPETPYVGLEHLPRKSITLREWGRSDSVSSGKLSFRCGDVLFGKIRPYFHKVAIAPFDGICSSDTILIRPKEDSLLGIVLCCSSSDQFVDYATQTSNGTKMPRADWKVLKDYPVLIPSNEILAEFNGFVLGVVNQARSLMLKNKNLRTQRDLLLPKIISGEIELSDIPMPT
jgi:type I restriction enzyme S subunit